jgi:hypothetical protein
MINLRFKLIYQDNLIINIHKSHQIINFTHFSVFSIFLFNFLTPKTWAERG